MARCEFDPTRYRGTPIGVFHCPRCGEMVVAGLPHPNYDEFGVEMRCGFCRVPVILPEEIELGVEYLCWNCAAKIDINR